MFSVPGGESLRTSLDMDADIRGIDFMAGDPWFLVCFKYDVVVAVVIFCLFNIFVEGFGWGRLVTYLFIFLIISY